MEFYFLLLLLSFSSVSCTNIRCAFAFYDHIHPPLLYKCLTLGVDIQSENENISSISGYHHSWKNTVDVERLEFVSIWSTYLPIGLNNFFPLLMEMEIRETPLRAIKRKNFFGLSRLTVLKIEDTKITNLANDTFEELYNLQELTIRKSLLAALPTTIFLPLESLRRFDGMSNRLTQLDRDLFRGNSKLESINFSGNELKQISINFTQLNSNVMEIFLFKSGCIDTYYVKKNSRYTKSNLQRLVSEKCTK